MRVERTRQLQELSSQSAAGPCTDSCSLTMSLVSSSAGQSSDQDIIHIFFSKPPISATSIFIYCSTELHQSIKTLSIKNVYSWFDLWMILWQSVAVGVLCLCGCVVPCVMGQSKAVMIKTVDTWHLISVTVIRAVTRRVWLWLLNCTLAWESHADAPGHRDKWQIWQSMFWCSLLLGIGSLKQSQTINSILVVLMLLYEQNVWAFKLYYAYLILYKRYLMNTLNRGRRQIAKTILAHCTTGLDGLLSNTTTIALLHTYTYLGLEY